MQRTYQETASKLKEKLHLRKKAYKAKLQDSEQAFLQQKLELDEMKVFSLEIQRKNEDLLSNLQEMQGNLEKQAEIHAKKLNDLIGENGEKTVKTVFFS